MSEFKDMETAFALINNAADLDGIKSAMTTLTAAVQANPQVLVANAASRQPMLNIFGETAQKAVSQINGENKLTVLAIWNESLAGAKAVINFIDTPQTESAAGEQQQQAANPASSSWLQRAFILRSFINLFVPSLTTITRALFSQSAELKEQVQSSIQNMLQLLVADVIFYDNNKDTKFMRNNQEVRIATEAAIQLCFRLSMDIPNSAEPVACAVKIFSEIVTNIINEERTNQDRLKFIVQSIQDLAAFALMMNRDPNTCARICAGLQGSVASLILPSNWELPIDNAAWSVAAAMASKMNQSNTAANQNQPSWVNSVFVKFLKDAETFLAEEEEEKKEDGNEEEKKATAKKPAAKKPAGKKPAGKKGGKKAAKTEEEDDEQEESTTEQQQASTDAAVSSSSSTNKAKLVFSRAKMLLENCYEASIRGLMLSNLLELASVIFVRLVDQFNFPAPQEGKSVEQIKAAILVPVWRQLYILVKDSMTVSPSTLAESEQQDQISKIQNFINKIASSAVRFGLHNSSLLIEVVLFTLVTIQSVASKNITFVKTVEECDGKTRLCLIQQQQQQAQQEDASTVTKVEDIVASAQGILSSQELKAIATQVQEGAGTADARAAMLKRVLWVLRSQEFKMKDIMMKAIRKAKRNDSGEGSEDDSDDDEGHHHQEDENNNNNGDDQQQHDEDDHHQDENNNNNNTNDEDAALQDETVFGTKIRQGIIDLSNAVNECGVRSTVSSIIHKLITALSNSNNNTNIPHPSWTMPRYQLEQRRAAGDGRGTGGRGGAGAYRGGRGGGFVGGRGRGGYNPSSYNNNNNSYGGGRGGGHRYDRAMTRGRN